MGISRWRAIKWQSDHGPRNDEFNAVAKRSWSLNRNCTEQSLSLNFKIGPAVEAVLMPKRYPKSAQKSSAPPTKLSAPDAPKTIRSRSNQPLRTNAPAEAIALGWRFFGGSDCACGAVDLIISPADPDVNSRRFWPCFHLDFYLMPSKIDSISVQSNHKLRLMFLSQRTTRIRAN